MEAELTAEERPAYYGERNQYSLSEFASAVRIGLTKIREVFKSSSYFLAYYRLNTSDSLRYMAKNSARRLFVFNGSKNSFMAEWRL